MNTITKKFTNPMANQRLKLERLEPTGSYCLVRLDPVIKRTKSGLVVPNLGGVDGQFVGADVKKQFNYDMTAVILKVGPDVEGSKPGERVLMTIPPIPITVADGDEELPLGLFDARDIHCKVVG